MRILVLSLEETINYVMDHYAPPGCEEFTERTDNYAVISFQDTHLGGFGIEFTENKYCKGVLTLYVDDIVKEVEGAGLFYDEHANQIVSFVDKHKDIIDTLVVHCYAGQSRSVAVGKALSELYNVNCSNIKGKNLNEHIYSTMINTKYRM